VNLEQKSDCPALQYGYQKTQKLKTKIETKHEKRIILNKRLIS